MRIEDNLLDDLIIEDKSDASFIDESELKMHNKLTTMIERIRKHEILSNFLQLLEIGNGTTIENLNKLWTGQDYPPMNNLKEIWFTLILSYDFNNVMSMLMDQIYDQIPNNLPRLRKFSMCFVYSMFSHYRYLCTLNNKHHWGALNMSSSIYV